MRDPADRPEPPAPRRPAASRTRRPRFALPVDHHDERTSEGIEAFLEGPVRARRTRARQPRTEALRRPRRTLALDTRTDWEAALVYEDARLARYGRPVSILVLEVRPDRPGATDRLVARVGVIIRHLARETDRVARVGPTRFHLLLPETLEPEAVALAGRVRVAWAATDAAGPQSGMEIAAAAVSPARGGTLLEALRQAQSRLAE